MANKASAGKRVWAFCESEDGMTVEQPFLTLVRPGAAAPAAAADKRREAPAAVRLPARPALYR